MTKRELEVCIAARGEAPRVTYAPPSIYPMAAPVFESSAGLDRAAQPEGPLGVYVHVPFCNYKCTFCFYATQPVPEIVAMERYVDAPERELAWIRPGTELTQLFVGGGTPTALPAELLDRVLEAIFARVRGDREIHTVECSPESWRPAHVRALQRHGIGRVSMGLQTGAAGVRTRLNRKHDDRQTLAAMALLVDAGFVVNVDLIYGLPGQDESSFRADVELAAAHGVHSITTYNLRVNEKTPIARLIDETERLDAPRLVRWRELAFAAARDCGFEQTRWHTYRRSAPVTAVASARRFRDVTGFGNQLGVGVSARSRLGDTIYRNHSGYASYLDHVEQGRSPVAEVHVLDDTERRLRFVTLTLGEGSTVDRARYAEIFGTPFDVDFGAPLARLRAAGIVADAHDHVGLTARGKLLYDLAVRAFYPESVRRWMEARQHLAPDGRTGS